LLADGLIVDDVGDLNWAWAMALVDGFAAAGARHAVLSPGSRSTPLALACLRHPELTCHVILDERVAGFFALGLAKADGAPCLLVATSGSAPANWHPAVAEAFAGRHPLLLLTADRPPELQDCGANQTIDQARLFGPHLRAFHALPPAEDRRDWLAGFCARAAGQSLWPLAGPIQINVPFREPLLGTGGVFSPQPACRLTRPEERLPTEGVRDLASRLSGRRGIIIAGAEPQAAAAMAALAEALNWPVLADPLSGLRFGPHDRSRVLARGDLFLRGDAPRPDVVLRFGAFPISKTVASWLSASEAEEIVVAGDPSWSDPQRRAAWMISARNVAGDLTPWVSACSPDWWEAFRRLETAAGALARPPEAAVIAALLEALPDDALLFLGNSMAVRDFDACSGTGEKRLTVMGNRGVSGIDGNIATFLGAAASGRFSAAAALVGDLTFLHDVGALAAGQGAKALICVLDNGGGGIFEHLPQAVLPEFSSGWLTPQSADLSAAAAVWGHGYIRGQASDVAAGLGRDGLTILHLPIDRVDSVAAHRTLWDAAKLLAPEPS
jgi:2-succinyl-5-enolpyruvyl-6-hydroxy-3-cyclohexene-1-carboxylate synthase